MVTISDIKDEDMKRSPIKTFQDGTEIRFKLGSGLKTGTRDFYQVAYVIGRKTISLNDQEIFEYCKRLVGSNNVNISNKVDVLVSAIYKLYKHGIYEMGINKLTENIQNMEIVINKQNKEVMVNMPKKFSMTDELLKCDSELIKRISLCTEKKIDDIVKESDIKSIDCTIEKKDNDLNISQNNIVDKLFGEWKFCHEKFLCYVHTLFISEDIYLVDGEYPTKYGRKLKMAGILYILKENWEPEYSAKQFHNRAGKEIEEKLKIIKKYDRNQKNIDDAWM